ncbi:PD-(D/E)XK nuclease family protein [Bradyrhizobium sp. SZCCHNR2023]|uniref:PD-(D/E)XK nuclease family protein n=1 Tax=Bradyrhizobium sp. SZCCHNR2023 TaxID=3057380 RepID=UPI00291632AB|nr:PD-(D/E)XK nuclease family protein [Bradyrhizobium sp. SZCCHNR2023]
MNRRTIIVEEPLAFRMRRIAAARQTEAGVQIITLSQLAARLAGGFTRPARTEDLDPGIRLALEAGGFAELESIRDLPGLARSVAWTLTRLWNADFTLADRVHESARLQDLMTIEARVRASLPAGVLSPRDLRDAALQRVMHAPTVLGAVELDRVGRVAPVWRPLLLALAPQVPLAWRNPGDPDPAWFTGELLSDARPIPASPEIVSCASPRAEAVEALRWIRELIASGRARPDEIAVCATATEDWDDHMVALAADAGLPLHFSHGMPALASREGQACAALADVLLNGLSQDRVRRLFGHVAGRSRSLDVLPQTWAQGLRPGAALFELEQWRRALDEAHTHRVDGVDVRPLLIPVLEVLARGAGAADEAGGMLLGRAARTLWVEALRRAPPEALEFSLQELRLPDGRDPGACAVWCPASSLAAAPRRFVRLLGLTTRSWPRRSGEDPLLPSHILSREALDSESLTEQDRRAYAIITAQAGGALVLSRSRRNAQGGLQAPSPLVPHGPRTATLKRARIPSHAFSEADRLLARPEEAATSPALRTADACWRNRRNSAVTPHDGRVRENHPVIARAIAQVQSATSLRLMLRDPLAFVWRYALGWRSLVEDEQPLSLDARAFGELVHEMLKRTVDALEPDPGYVRAARHQIENALDAASAAIAAQWSIERSIPPVLLWRHTLAAARDLALKALTLDEAFQPVTRSWTELAFGREDDGTIPAGDLLWPPTGKVIIPGAGLRIRGSIDRVDFNSAHNGVRVSDYKTGAEPAKASEIVLGRGAELQRVLYALAARQLVADNPRVIARLVFLGTDRPRPYNLPDVDQAIADIAAHLSAAVDLLRRGVALPGPDAREDWNDFALALPAAPAVYFQIKQAALGRAFGDFARIWSVR